MFSKILFPVNLFDVRPNSLEQVFEIVRSLNAEVHFLHVHTPVMVPMQNDSMILGSPMGGELYVNPTNIQPPNIDDFTAAVLRAYPPIKECDARFKVIVGGVTEGIVEYVHENLINMVITEHHQASGMFHWFFRSEDEEIINKVDVPILVLPHR